MIHEPCLDPNSNIPPIKKMKQRNVNTGWILVILRKYSLIIQEDSGIVDILNTEEGVFICSGYTFRYLLMK